MNKTACWFKVSLVCILLPAWISCEREGNEEGDPLTIESLQGQVQKGPYLNGTSITVAELTSGLSQTGKNFTTQINDNSGRFELNQLQLSTPFVELAADGFYFNEISGESSLSRLILYAISNLEDKTTLNVNVLSHLERGRVLELVSGGMDFSSAKKQAQQEVLGIFSLSKSDMAESVLLDIAGEGEDNAMLLAISVILQGYRSVGELSELLAGIHGDFREDGILDSGNLGSALMNQAVVLNMEQIRTNLEERYAGLGLEVTLPGFEPYVEHFIENSGFEVTSRIEYPATSPYGENMLVPEITTIQEGQDYSMAADLPDGAQLKIRLSGGLWFYVALPDAPVNWAITKYDHQEREQTFTSIEPGTRCDLRIQFAADTAPMPDTVDFTPVGNQVLVEYFENQSDRATHVKTLTIEPQK